MPPQSLNRKLLIPLLVAVVLATALVATVAYVLAGSRAERELEQRRRSIQAILESDNLPLNSAVFQVLANLTAAHWFALRDDGSIVMVAWSDDLPAALDPEDWSAWQATLADVRPWSPTQETTAIRVGTTRYRGIHWRRARPRTTRDGVPVTSLIVLIDESQQERLMAQSIALPALVGLIAIGIVAAVTLATTTRWVRRISQLQQGVRRIAEGDFQTQVPVHGQDELSQLATDVTRLAAELSGMWDRLRRLHSEQMLHQLSAGLAHNLRNSLAGARMAIELAALANRPKLAAMDDPCRQAQAESLVVAVRQIEQAEEYIQRILWLAGGREAPPRPMTLDQCLATLRDTLDATAQHRGKQLHWSLPTALSGARVADSQVLMAAVSNLVWNALEAGQDVLVAWRPAEQPDLAQVCVSDNGPGPPVDIQDRMFEPFVTATVDGSGLGLAFVARAAQRLGGQVHWQRSGARTEFIMTFRWS